MRVIVVILFWAFPISISFCQGLESIPVISIVRYEHAINPSVSFILTITDNFEIIDANNPWPPRWFAASYVEQADTAHVTRRNVYSDARVQNGYVTYTNIGPLGNNKDGKSGYIICNKKMEPVDTVRSNNMMLNAHDFRINKAGERLIAIRQDTILNMSNKTGNLSDTAVNAMLDVIEILDSNNKTIFEWNPVNALGVNALYKSYGDLTSLSSVAGMIDWSHVNALAWDFDGNILYCFRHIGVGKISRADGHVIWQLDRNQMPFISGTDTIAFYLQHGFDKVSDHEDYTTYSLYSNGDSLHPLSYGLEFNIDKLQNRLTLVKKKIPVNIVSSGAAGNYEISANGDYLMNYGSLIGKKDTSKQVVYMEYGNEQDHLYALYTVSTNNKSIRVYKVHMMEDWRPPRPEIKKASISLKAKGVMKEWIWYQLSGPDNTIVQKKGNGPVFKPATKGTYCVAGKYGIGWSVSLPFNYTP